MSVFKKIVICLLCVACCYLLPLALGATLCPMHIPVLVCGLVCGTGYGAACGILGPVFAALLTGTASVDGLAVILPELIAYGVFCGVFMKAIRTKSLLLNLYLSLIPAMLLGRIVGGLFRAAYSFLGVFGVGAFSLREAFRLHFTSTLPGIVVHLIFVPMFIVTLKEERIIKLK